MKEIRNMFLTVVVGLLFVACITMHVKLKSVQSEKEIPEDKNYKVVSAKLTAYCPCEKCCGKYADGITSIGRNAKTTRGVAVDPKMIKYKSMIDISGIGTFMADDTGGAMRQSGRKGIYHIDVRFHDHQEAKNFGVKFLDIKIYEPSPANY